MGRRKLSDHARVMNRRAHIGVLCIGITFVMWIAVLSGVGAYVLLWN